MLLSKFLNMKSYKNTLWTKVKKTTGIMLVGVLCIHTSFAALLDANTIEDKGRSSILRKAEFNLMANLLGKIVVEDQGTSTQVEDDTFGIGQKVTGSDLFTNGTFTTDASDWALPEDELGHNADAIDYLYVDTETVTLSQATIAGLEANTQYLFSYTITAFNGSPTLKVTDTFAASETTLPVLSVATHSVILTSADPAPDDFVLEITGASTESFTIDNLSLQKIENAIDITADGNVGIGTATPTVNLHLYQESPTADQVLFQVGTDGDASRVAIDEDGDLTADGTITANAFSGDGSALTNMAMTINGTNIHAGTSALGSLTTGSANIALGPQSLMDNTSGSSNIALGYQSLTDNTTGNLNISSGSYALNYNTTGSGNIATGYQSLADNTTGAHNIGFGLNAGFSNTIGLGNIYLGQQAGDSVTSGSRNILIGYNVDAPSATADNQLNIGNALYGDLDVDILLDADGTTTVRSGTPTLAKGATLTPVEAATFVCTDSLTSPTQIAIDNDSDCSNGAAGGTTILGYSPSAAKTLVNNTHNWAFADALADGGNNDGFFDAGEDLYLDQGTLGTYDAFGKIGIGTATPTQALDVIGTTLTSNIDLTTDILVDANGADADNPKSIGSPSILADGATLTAVEAADQLCTDSLTNPTTVTLDSAQNDCGTGDETLLVGSTASEADIVVNSSWAFADIIGGGTFDAAEDLYIDRGTSGIFDESGTLKIDGITVLKADNSLNVATGRLALNAVTNGLSNTATGANALLVNTSGSSNTATGASALSSNTSGIHNTATGKNALDSNTTGFSNTATGIGSLYSNTTGSNNTAIGKNSFYNLSDKTGSITAFADNGDGKTEVTVANHGLTNNSKVTLSGTTWYDGDSIIEQKTSNTFVIDRSFEADTGTGTFTTATSNNIAIGAFAGYHHKSPSDLLIIDNQKRGSADSEREKAIIYGLMGLFPSNQELYLNAEVSIAEELHLRDDDDNYLGFKAPSDVTGDYVLTLPPAVADAADKVLATTDNAGTLGWVATSTFGGATSLDTAYDGGAFITANGDPVAITVPDTGNNAALTIAQNDTTNNPVAMSITNTGTGNSLVVDGNILQQGGTSSAIYTPTEIAVIKDDSQSGTATGLNGAQGLNISGSYLYIVGYADDALSIIDISNPTTPIEVGVIKDDGQGGTATALDGPRDVVVLGNYAYVIASNDDSLSILDISNPTTPTEVGVIKDDTQGGTATSMNNPWQLAIAGHYAYVLGKDDDALSIIDISDPTTPTEVGVIKDDGQGGTATALDDPRGLITIGHYAYIVSSISDSLSIIDISDSTTPTEVGVIQDDGQGGTATALDGPTGLKVLGSYAYITSYGSTSLSIIDISDPTTPTEAGVIKDDGQGGTATVLDWPERIDVSGDYAYVTSYDGNNDDDAISIIDISDPTTPTEVGVIKDDGHTLGGTATGLNGAWDIEISGRYAYVSSLNDDALSILDISGIEIQSALIHSLEAGSTNITGTLSVSQNISGDSLNIGSGGIYSRGSVAASSFVGDGDLTIGGRVTIENNERVGTSSNNWFFNDDYAIIATTSNVGIGTISVGTNANNVLAMHDGTAPISSPPGIIQMWAEDLSGADTAGLKILNENDSVITFPNTTGTLALIGGISLDDAYDGGATIAVDGDAVTLTGSHASNKTLDVTNSANGGVVAVTNTGTGDSLVVNTDDFVIDDEGNIGIGTPSPTANLHVYQDAPTANQTLFQVGTSDDSSRFTIDEDGDVRMDGDLVFEKNMRSMNGLTGGSANMAVAFGATMSQGTYTFTQGINSVATGDNAVAMNNASSASGDNASAFGSSDADSFLNFTIGKNNVGGGTADSWVETDPLFEIGNGEGMTGQEQNAITLLKRGELGIGLAAPTAQLHIQQNVNKLSSTTITSETGGSVDIDTAAAHGLSIGDFVKLPSASGIGAYEIREVTGITDSDTFVIDSGITNALSADSFYEDTDADLLLIEQPDGTDLVTIDETGKLTAAAYVLPSDATTSATNQITIDPTNATNDLVFYGDAENVLSPLQTKTVVIAQPTGGADDIMLMRAPYDLTIKKISGIVDPTEDVGDTVDFRLYEFDVTGATGTKTFVQAIDIQVGHDGNQLTTGFADAAIPKDRWIGIEVTAHSGTVDFLTVTFEYTKDRE